MNAFASVVLIGWPLAVLLLFWTRSPRTATLASYVVAWLFLPVGEFRLPGLPDYNKVSATTVSVTACVILFDRYRLEMFRLRWFDGPLIIWCACPIASSLSNGLGLYDGLSSALSQTVAWGLPYLVGRLYLGDREGLRALALAILLGGLAYVPLCLWEVRMSPQLQATLYGRGRFFNAVRYGGYRPLVFMVDGLEVGMWMTAASLIGVWLWAAGGRRRLGPFPLGPCLAVLLVTTVLCKATGALILLAVGIATLLGGRLARRTFPIVLLMALPLLYISVRTSQLWSGASMVRLADDLVGAERAQSLAFRLRNEDLLVDKALVQPLFGWGGWKRNRVFDQQGHDITTTDGFWIIALGIYGFVGLGAATAVILLPPWLLVRHRGRKHWYHPVNAPAVALSVLLVLYFIDCLFNYMPNPIYLMISGGILGLGDPGSIPGDTKGQMMVEPSAEADGATCNRIEEARYEQAIVRLEALAARRPTVAIYRRELAMLCRELGMQLADRHRPEEARPLLLRAAELWEELEAQEPHPEGHARPAPPPPRPS